MRILKQLYQARMQELLFLAVEAFLLPEKQRAAFLERVKLTDPDERRYIDDAVTALEELLPLEYRP